MKMKSSRNSGTVNLGNDEMISLSPVAKSSPNVNNDRTMTPPRLVRPTLQHQHSYAGHEESITFSSNNSVNSNSRQDESVSHRAIAPSGRHFLSTRHLSMENISHNSHSEHRQHHQQRLQSQLSPPSLFHQSRWTLQPSYAINPRGSYRQPLVCASPMRTPGSSNNNSHADSGDLSHSFTAMLDQHAPAFSPADDDRRDQPSPSSARGQDIAEAEEEEIRTPISNNPQREEEEQEGRTNEDETDEERARREEEESLALAQLLMAEEAMASHRMSADFLQINSDQFSPEDFAALQNALAEEEEEDDDEEELGDEVEGMSYDALLQLSERIGDVKADRWAIIAHREIAKLEVYQYDPDKVFGKEKQNGSKGENVSSLCENKIKEEVDDSEIKCLVCQFQYEKGDELRKLPCGHCFHKDCIDQWLKTKDICAYCRQPIVKDDDDNDDGKKKE